MYTRSLGQLCYITCNGEFCEMDDDGEDNEETGR